MGEKNKPSSAGQGFSSKSTANLLCLILENTYKSCTNPNSVGEDKMSLLQTVDYKKDLEWKIEKEGTIYIVSTKKVNFHKNLLGHFNIGQLLLNQIPSSDSPKGENDFYVENITMPMGSFEIFAEDLNAALLSRYSKYMKYQDIKEFFWSSYRYYAEVSARVKKLAGFTKN